METRGLDEVHIMNAVWLVLPSVEPLSIPSWVPRCLPYSWVFFFSDAGYTYQGPFRCSSHLQTVFWVTDVSSVSGLFFISTVIDAGHTCGQSFRNMIGNAGFAPEQHFARLSLGLWNLKCISLKT